MYITRRLEEGYYMYITRRENNYKISHIERKPKSMFTRGLQGHVIFNLHLGVGQSVLCQKEGVGHVIFIHPFPNAAAPGGGGIQVYK